MESMRLVRQILGVRDASKAHLAGLELSPRELRLCPCCALPTRWVHSCSSSAPEAPDRVYDDLHNAGGVCIWNQIYRERPGHVLGPPYMRQPCLCTRRASKLPTILLGFTDHLCAHHRDLTNKDAAANVHRGVYVALALTCCWYVSQNIAQYL